MEPGIVLVVLVIFGIPIALAIWLIVRAIRSEDRIGELSRRLGDLESEIFRLKREKESLKSVEPTATTVPPGFEETAPGVFDRPAHRPVTLQPIISPETPSVVMPPVISVTTEPPKLPPVIESPRPPVPKINWEQFMGVKGFAWVGGLALFLGVAFFIKYSFDNNLVPPELRVAIGFLTGLGLLVGGVVMSRKNFPALSQTLCATGVVILYAVTFACHSIYHFEFFGSIPTFLLMALITTAAFLVAVRLNALVVAILGMLGGFLTPILLSTGQDNPLGLFGYIAILDAGLIIVALNRRWYFLTAPAALGTAIMQIGWVDKFFVSGRYFEGNRILIAFGVLLGFTALFLAGSWWSKIRKPANNGDALTSAITPGWMNKWLSGSTLGLVALAFAFTAWFLSFTPLALQPWLMFGFVFLVDLVAVALVLLDEKISPAQSVSGFAVFGLLALWTSQSLSNELLNAALAFYFIFAVVHSVLPALLQRRRGVGTQSWANHLFPILALALVLLPVFKLAEEVIRPTFRPHTAPAL